MKTKKSNKKQTIEGTEKSKPEMDSFEVGYNQPPSSPYGCDDVHVIIGGKSYSIPAIYLDNAAPHLHHHRSWGPNIVLSRADKDIGHTIIHFLCTGTYETLSDPVKLGETRLEREYNRSLLVYKAATTYSLSELADLAKGYIERFTRSVTIYVILERISQAFSSFAELDDWMRDYLKRCLRVRLARDRSLFTRDEFYNALRGDADFHREVMRIVAGLLSSDHRQAKDTTCAEDAAPSGWLEDPDIHDERESVSTESIPELEKKESADCWGEESQETQDYASWSDEQLPTPDSVFESNSYGEYYQQYSEWPTDNANKSLANTLHAGQPTAWGQSPEYSHSAWGYDGGSGWETATRSKKGKRNQSQKTRLPGRDVKFPTTNPLPAHDCTGCGFCW
ncbi:hypothetical protein BJX70DRAFT_372832 [Aspergillus crustosus]